MKQFINLIFILFILIALPVESKATELDLLEMNVALQENGDAVFTNKFNYDDDKGTEHYFVLDGLADSKIKDFTVTRNGQKMEFKEDWNVDESLEEKAGKYGIVEKNNGYELCYGITEYGINEFIVEYTITNFVKQLTDTQMMYWEFISRNFGDEPKNAKIIIEKGGYEFTSENARIWAFGYKGTILFEDGKIIASSKGKLDEGNKMTVLTKFEEPVFTPNSIIDNDFMYYKEQAFEGSSYDINDTGEGGSSLVKKRGINYFTMAMIFFRPLMLFALVFIPLFFISRSRAKRIRERINSDDYKGIKVDKINYEKSDYNNQYYREIPYEGNLSDLYLIIDRDVYALKYYMPMYFLKWIKDGKMEVIKEEKGRLFKKEEASFKILDLEYTGKTYLEKTLYDYIISAAGENNILESKEFSKWMRNNKDEISKLEDKAEDISRDKLTKLGYLEEQIEVTKYNKYRNIVLTEKGKELVGNLVKFENYLKDYSLLNEKDSYNVHIWDSYMLYAALFGITEEVEKEFKNLYPNYEVESNYDYYIVASAVRMSTVAYSSYTAASSSSSDSSGFGGSSSFGGGGGSFGGGGGGTR